MKGLALRTPVIGTLALTLSQPAIHLAVAQRPPANSPPIVLDESTRLEGVNTRLVWTEHRGRRALRLAPLPGHEHDSDQEMSAILTSSDFTDGVIDVDLSGARRNGYATDNVSAYKGFVGISFRVRGDSAERVYLRPENARLDDQIFRNRTVQYEAPPDYPWQRLRQENPGVYETYADMEAGGWTHLRIAVEGRRARVYVNGAAQPTLVINDLRLGVSRGAIALWARISSDAYFSNLRVTGDVPNDAAVERPAQTKTGRAVALPAIREAVNGVVERVDYHGRPAIKLVPTAAAAGSDGSMLALLDGPDFRDGTIQLDVAGSPRTGASASARGFIGVSFRTGVRGEWSEVFYLRPTNGRSDDQLRRNHAVQYVSDPEYPWYRLREENPGKYEAYADLQPGEWTTMRIEVAGPTARLYVNGASEPTLVVTDLKRGSVSGRIALWAQVDTDAYFGALAISRR